MSIQIFAMCYVNMFIFILNKVSGSFWGFYYQSKNIIDQLQSGIIFN